jgi:TATA-box binding protein (TBP) (component of TFIID and TFIIIB)
MEEDFFEEDDFMEEDGYEEVIEEEDDIDDIGDDIDDLFPPFCCVILECIFCSLLLMSSISDNDDIDILLVILSVEDVNKVKLSKLKQIIYIIITLIMMYMDDIFLVRKFTRNLKLDSDFCDLPYDLKIATITITCQLNTFINVHTIGHYMELNKNDIVCVKYGYESLVRSLIKVKKAYKVQESESKKLKDKNFQNQVSITMAIKRDKYIHLKLFSNGAVQLTGCKSVGQFVEVMKKLCSKLLTFQFAYNTVTKKTIKKVFVTNPNFVMVNKVTNLAIRMVNTSFHVGFMIDRVALYNLLLKLNHTVTFDSAYHAGVNLKYISGSDTITLLIFESGSIIITGLKTKHQIWDGYEFIIKFLHEHYNKIVKVNMEKLLKRPDIKNMVNTQHI